MFMNKIISRFINNNTDYIYIGIQYMYDNDEIIFPLLGTVEIDQWNGIEQVEDKLIKIEKWQCNCDDDQIKCQSVDYFLGDLEQLKAYESDFYDIADWVIHQNYLNHHLELV